ncbi:MAG: V0D/AC39 family V-type ATPase subunit [Ruminococcus sp.]|jgi:V/A-type H+-transporting ATPase subunit C
MSDKDYTYAVARIRALELSLFSASVLEQLISCADYESAVSFLLERGWGDTQGENDGESILKREREKTWETIEEMVSDMSPFDVLSYQNLFHNLKAAIKGVCTDQTTSDLFYEGCSISAEEMIRIVKEKDFDSLPEFMRQAAKEAYETLLHGRDGQLCDVILDRAALEAVREAGEKSDVGIIRDYARSLAAVSNIKIAVRCCRTGKSLDFMKRAMVECEDLNVEKLMKAALQGEGAIRDYLGEAGFKEAADALFQSSSAFECWCDNRLIETIRPQKYNPFSVGPLIAYILARENEIKTVRIILTGKQNHFPESAIRERMREMYV